MGQQSYRTAEERTAARKAANEAIAKLQEKLEPEQSKRSKLISENQSKIDSRSTLQKKIQSKKSTGKALIIIGVIALVICAITLAAIESKVVGVIAGIVGIVGIIIGIIIFSGHKTYAHDLEHVNRELSDFDKKNGALSETISDLERQIYMHNKVLEEVALAEKYEKVNNWIESISTGHVVIYASSENHLFEERPREPEAKMYDSLTLTNVQLYVNDMLYGTLEGRYQKRNFGVFEVDENGTQKTEFLVNYHIGNSGFNYQTAPVPVKYDQKSMYCWFHVSTCQKGTKVYAQNYNSLEALLEDSGISKSELMKLVGI